MTSFMTGKIEQSTQPFYGGIHFFLGEDHESSWGWCRLQAQNTEREWHGQQGYKCYQSKVEGLCFAFNNLGLVKLQGTSKLQLQHPNISLLLARDFISYSNSLQKNEGGTILVEGALGLLLITLSFRVGRENDN